ncbi:MAG TPA: TIGR01212 family radical SAM protein [Aquificaceae bacterium]|nr:TIGR01212 family radical SAM protein [Aquificaceae bacterium]
MELIRYFRLYAKERFGTRVQKIPVALTFTCPNIDGSKGRGGCIYCYKGSRPAHLEPWTPLKKQIEEGIQRARERYGKKTRFFVYYQSYTNTYGNIELLKNIYDVALEFEEVVGIDVGTRPDCAPDEVLELLSSYKEMGLEVWIEFGLQSANFETLKKINRQHGVSDLVDAVLRAKKYDLLVCVHTIVGLPGEGKEDFMETAKLIASLPVDGVKIHPIYVMKNTELAKLYLSGEFNTLSLEEYTSFAADMLEIIPENVIVHRLTAEAEKEKLLSPDYCVYERKLEVIGAIEEELRKRGTKQGIKNPFSVSLSQVKGTIRNFVKVV